MAFERLIRDIPDFPKPGILFKDILPVLADAAGFAAAVEALAAPWRAAGIDRVCGIEARGFILGAALARALDVGFVPVRKPIRRALARGSASNRPASCSVIAPASCSTSVMVTAC